MKFLLNYYYMTMIPQDLWNCACRMVAFEAMLCEDMWVVVCEGVLLLFV